MSKYLFFIIIGIILFLYINSIEGLNVGGKDIGEDCEEDGNCNDGNGICQNDHCYCVDVGGNSICQLKTPDPNADGEKGRRVQDRISKINDIKLQNQSKKAVSHLSSQCASIHYPILNKLNVAMTGNDNTPKSYCRVNGRPIILRSPCHNIEQQQLYNLSCDFDFTYEDDTPPNNYENFGYEKLPGFIDLENDSIFQGFIGQIQKRDFSKYGYLNHPTLNLGHADTPLNFNTYMLIKYIERISNSNIKTIVAGIFYCNGKIYYYISFYGIFRIVNSNPSIYYIDDPYLVEQMNKYYYLSKFETHSEDSFSQIHVDAPNIGGIPPKVFTDYGLNTPEISVQHDMNDKPEELLRTEFNLNESSCESSTSFSILEQALLGTDFNPISFKKAFNNEMTLRTQSELNVQTGNFENASLMLYHLINHNKADDNYDLFNIWLQLVGSYDDKTLGFFNSPPTNEGLEELAKIDNDDTKLSVIYSSYEENIVSVDHLPDKTARTFVMNDGDAFRFTDDKTPHFGRSSEHGIRFSKEGRYLLYHIDFDLNNVFEIIDDGRKLLLVVKTNEGTREPSETPPPYLPLTIYKYFQDQFVIIRDIYDSLYENGDLQDYLPQHITMNIFIHVLDNITFEDYMNNQEENIRRFLIDLF